MFFGIVNSELIATFAVSSAFLSAFTDAWNIGEDRYGFQRFFKATQSGQVDGIGQVEYFEIIAVDTSCFLIECNSLRRKRPLMRDKPPYNCCRS